MNGIVVKGLKKTYGTSERLVKALDGVDFEINAGEFAVILGPSGSGKSTLLNILGGMDGASEGTAEVFGKDVTKFNAKELVAYRRKDIGFVFQFYNLMPNLTARENVAIACCEGGMDELTALKEVGLLERGNNFPSQLSGGEQQRVAIARAIVKRPPLLLCDEPTGALDSKTGRMIVSLLRRLQKEYAATVVIVTHNAKLAEIADKVIRLSDGRIAEITQNENPIEAGEIEW